MLSVLAAPLAFSAAKPPPYPFPQDCSNVNATTGAPGWFKECGKAAGGCFKIAVPKETKYNIGNTTFGASKAGGTEWCIDHLQGFVYSKVIDPVGAMYYEVDDRSGSGTAPQCRFLTGFDGDDAKKNPIYHARAYNPAGLECDLTDQGSKDGVHSYGLTVKRTAPPLAKSPPAVTANAAPVQLIIDTDLGFDVDDVGAIAVAHALADQGHVDLIGVVCNTGRDACPVGVDIINTYYGRSSTPIGSFKGKFGSYTDNGQDSHYVNDVKGKFPHTVNGRNDVKDALDVYRTALQNAADKSVTIASIGEPTNLQELLQNEKELVRSKVKRVVYMDGDFNFGCADGAYGPNDECWKSAQYVVSNMPSPDVEQIFQLHGDNHNGWWVGNNAKCGYDEHNPVKVAYSDMCRNAWGGACDNYGRDSWDPNTVYVAIMGASGGGQCNIGSGRACAYSVSDDGKTEYRDYNDHSKNMYDFSLIGDISSVGNTIEDLLCAAPKLGSSAATPTTRVADAAPFKYQYAGNSSAPHVEQPVSARKGPRFG